MNTTTRSLVLASSRSPVTALALATALASGCVDRVDAPPARDDTGATSTSATTTTGGAGVTDASTDASADAPVATDDADSTGSREPDVPPPVPPPPGGLGPWGFGYVEYPDVTAHGIATADFDGDGRDDLLTQDDDWIVSVYISDGAGGLSLASSRSVPPNRRMLRTGDFDGDGDVDAAMFGRGAEDDAFLVLLNDGQGTFEGVQPVPLGGFFHFGVRSLDVDGDAAHDLFIPEGSVGEDYLALAQGDGTFVPGPAVESFWCFVASSAAGDLDEDGLDDLLITGSCNSAPDFVPIAVYTSAGASLAQTQTLTSEHGPVVEQGDIRLLDFDRDGDTDAVIGTEGALVVALNDGTGTFVDPPTALPHDYPGYVAQILPLTLGPGDGPRGFVVGNLVDRETPAAALLALDETRLALSTDALDLQGPVLGGADLDGDGRVDPIVVVPERGGTLAVWLSGG